MAAAGTWKTAYADDEVEVAACPLCGADAAEHLAEEWALILARCRSCGWSSSAAGSTTRRPTTVPTRASAAQVRTGAQRRGGARPRAALRRAAAEARAVPRPGTAARHRPVHGLLRPPCRAREGWDVEGVDPSPTIAQIVPEHIGVEVRLGYLEELGLEDEFDVVTFLDVLEHVRNPVEVLDAARRALRPGGVVLVKVPHARWNHLKRRLRFRDAYDAREHILQFRAETLEEAFRRAGPEPVELFLPGPVQGGTWRRRIPRRAVWLLGAALFRLRGKPGPLSLDLALIGRRPAGGAPQTTRREKMLTPP